MSKRIMHHASCIMRHAACGMRHAALLIIAACAMRVYIVGTWYMTCTDAHRTQ